MRFLALVNLITIAMASPSVSYSIPDGISVSKEVGKYVIYLKGEIQSGDAAVVEEIFREAVADSSMVEMVLIDNVGGSVSDAIDIGRMARSWDSITRISGYCYSSCSLVYVGGSVRIAAFDAVLGLHRPYFAIQPGVDGPNTDNVDDLYGAVKSYLEEMNISPKFFDEMISVPPSDMKLVEGSNIEEWVPMKDPVYEEISVSLDARRYGIGTLEYRRIDSFDFYPLCESIGESGTNQSICAFLQREAALWGVSEEDYERVEGWVLAARETCEPSTVDLEILREVSAEKKLLALEARSPKPYREIDMAPERIAFQECVVGVMRSAEH